MTAILSPAGGRRVFEYDFAGYLASLTEEKELAGSVEVDPQTTDHLIVGTFAWPRSLAT